MLEDVFISGGCPVVAILYQQAPGLYYIISVMVSKIYVCV